MVRIFLSPEQLTSDEVMITGDNARHLSLVLRTQPGDTIAILDGHGKRYICKVLTVHKKEVVAEKITEESYSAESPISLTLAQGLPKGDRMDLIIQKSVELGVKRIVPVITERAQVRTTEKVSRWRKIALSASQQSGREVVPEVDEPISFKDFINNLLPSPSKNVKDPESPTLENSNQLAPERSKLGLYKIILSESHGERNLKEVLSNLKDAQDITLLVGPEGGFSKEEVSTAVEKGFIEVSLGPRILRTETAPITAISIIQYELGDMG
jgi:16S rRNA (uracil1498-N3)-methyltransferase